MKNHNSQHLKTHLKRSFLSVSSCLFKIDEGLAYILFWRSVPSIQELIVLTFRTNRAAEGSISELILSCSQWEQNIPLWSSFTWFAWASWKPVLILLMLGFLGLKEIDGTDITHCLQAAVRLDRASRVVKTHIKKMEWKMGLGNRLFVGVYSEFATF